MEDEEEIKVENPGDCLGHYNPGCRECQECEIASPCRMETEGKNGKPSDGHHGRR